MEENFDWAVVGAGPAGMAAVAKLLDAGVRRIAWIDPEFRVGDLGSKWQHVPGNTKVELFMRFLNASPSFAYQPGYPIDRLDPGETCLLRDVVVPLQAIADRLRTKVSAIEGTVLSLKQESGGWTLEMEGRRLFANKVIAAIGSEPKKLEGPSISLECALHPDRLKNEIKSGDVVGIFGSSHSAVLALANLMRTTAAKVYNFYRTPHRYAIYQDGWILYDDIGLKGFTAKWAREHLDTSTLPKLHRMLVTDALFAKSLSECNKTIYAIGFEARELVKETHCQETGKIQPRLFGCGIAFPQVRIDPVGNPVIRIGLWKFMDDLNRLIPLWIAS